MLEDHRIQDLSNIVRSLNFSSAKTSLIVVGDDYIDGEVVGDDNGCLASLNANHVISGYVWKRNRLILRTMMKVER